MEKRRTYWEYLKSDKFSNITITLIAIILGIISISEQAYLFTILMITVLLVLYIGNYIDWKKRG